MTKRDDLAGVVIDHDSPIPLHRQVEVLLRRMIEDPKFQNGKLLPKETDMAKRWGISRNTIRQATNKLVHEDLLVRKKGVGTKVKRKGVTTKLDNWFSFSREMQENGINFINYHQSVKFVKADAEVADHLGIELGKEVLRLIRLRGLDDGPFVYFISYFHPRIGLTGKEDFSRHLYEILENDYACLPSISKEEIRAITATKKIAEKLNITKNAPVLYRKRVVCDPGDRPLEYNLGYYRADKFAYSIDIKR